MLLGWLFSLTLPCTLKNNYYLCASVVFHIRINIVHGYHHQMQCRVTQVVMLLQNQLFSVLLINLLLINFHATLPTHSVCSPSVDSCRCILTVSSCHNFLQTLSTDTL